VDFETVACPFAFDSRYTDIPKDKQKTFCQNRIVNFELPAYAETQFQYVELAKISALTKSRNNFPNLCFNFLKSRIIFLNLCFNNQLSAVLSFVVKQKHFVSIFEIHETCFEYFADRGLHFESKNG